MKRNQRLHSKKYNEDITNHFSGRRKWKIGSRLYLHITQRLDFPLCRIDLFHIVGLIPRCLPCFVIKTFSFYAQICDLCHKILTEVKFYSKKQSLLSFPRKRESRLQIPCRARNDRKKNVIPIRFLSFPRLRESRFRVRHGMTERRRLNSFFCFGITSKKFSAKPRNNSFLVDSFYFLSEQKVNKNSPATIKRLKIAYKKLKIENSLRSDILFS